MYQKVLEPKSVYEVPAGCAVTSKSRDQCAGTSRKVSSSCPKIPAMIPESSAWQQRTSVSHHPPACPLSLSNAQDILVHLTVNALSQMWSFQNLSP